MACTIKRHTHYAPGCRALHYNAHEAADGAVLACCCKATTSPAAADRAAWGKITVLQHALQRGVPEMLLLEVLLLESLMPELLPPGCWAALIPGGQTTGPSRQAARSSRQATKPRPQRPQPASHKAQGSKPPGPKGATHQPLIPKQKCRVTIQTSRQRLAKSPLTILFVP